MANNLNLPDTIPTLAIVFYFRSRSNLSALLQ